MEKEFEINDKRVTAIAEHYGMENQREQLIEELSELILASQKCKRNGTKDDFNNFCGELADVYIMVQQMIYLISPEVIGSIVDKKLDRQMQRIADETGVNDMPEIPEVDTRGMQIGDVKKATNGTAWRKVQKL